MTEWKKVESERNFWLPEEKNTELIGVVKDVQDGDYGKVYLLDTEEGDVWTPSHKVLQNRMVDAKEGVKVKIVFKGEEPPAVKGNNPTRLYDVFFAQ